MTAKHTAGRTVQPGKPVSKTFAGNVRNAFDGDIADFTLGMGVDHADAVYAAHVPAAARSAVIVVRGEMASVAVTISTIAPVGAAQARA